MADTNTQKQTAATDTAPGHAPAGADKSPTVHKPGGPATSKELDLEALLGDELGAETVEEADPELDRDLPKGKSKKGNQAPEKPKAKAKASESEDEETEDETDALNSAVADDESEDEEEEDEAETDGDDEATDEAGEEETEEEEDESALDADVDPSKPPKGYEKVPKGIWKRHNKLRADNRELKARLAEGPVLLQPTPESPLSDVDDIETLDERVSQARADRDWTRKNPEGGTRKVNGKEVEISAEQAAEMLSKAEQVIDADATTRTRLMFRAQSKPWEAAQAVAPEMFTKGSAEHTFMLGVLQACPEITQKHPQWEYLLACAAKGMRQVVEERSGKARYVRFELDANGKLIPLRKQKTVNGSGTAQAGADNTAKPKPKAPPASPGSARPPLTRRADGQKKPVVTTVGDSDAGLGALLAAELGE